MVDSIDHLTGVPGLTPTVQIRKPGGVFAPPAGVVSEVGLGWYQLAPTAVDTDTLGPLLLHAEAVGADPVDGCFSCELALVGEDGAHGPTAAQIARELLASAILSVTPSAQLVDINGNQLADVTLAQALAALAMNILGDRAGAGTRSITASLPGLTGCKLVSNRTSSTQIQTTATLPAD